VRFVLMLIAVLAFTAAHAQQQQLPLTKYTAGMNIIAAEVASTPAQIELGLMYRKELVANNGMMFILGHSPYQCMWMKNTLIPLSVAFMDRGGVILNIEEMLPQTLAYHCAGKPAEYALEMAAGWFRRKGIKPGSKVELMK